MRILAVLAIFSLLGMAGQPAHANGKAGGPNCCAHCGQHVACVQKVCQVVCDVKKETKVRYSVQCEDVCPLMPACHHGQDCCSAGPRCGHPKTVKKLVKEEYQVEIPVYKGVVQYVCPVCAGNGSAPVVEQKPTPAAPPPAPTSNAAPLPPPPPAPARGPKTTY